MDGDFPVGNNIGLKSTLQKNGGNMSQIFFYANIHLFRGKSHWYCVFIQSVAQYRVFNLKRESAANLCITLTFWCFLSCCKNPFEGALMTDLSQPDPLTALTLTLLCSILQSAMVLLGGFCLGESSGFGIC